MYVPEGPLPPRPERSGKGGPSINQGGSTPPVLSAGPTITGTPTVGSTLTCSQGTWFNSPTSYAYQWLRDGANIAGATASTYVVVAGDLGHAISCKVTATNAFGSTPATSNAVLIVALPANTAAPVASGSLTVGSTLSCTQGTWTNSPTSYAYQWQRGGVNISGATSASYVTVSADGGTSVGCLVTASNAAGSASQASNTLAIAGGVATSVWSAADAAANGMTLTNGGLTANVTAASLHNAWQILRGSTSKTSGKLYVEFSTSTGQTITFQIGLASVGVNINDYLGNSNYSLGLSIVGSTVFASAGFSGATSFDVTGAAIANDVYALAIDFTAGSIWLLKNNVYFQSGNPVQSFVPATVGALFPAMAFSTSGSNATWTLQPTAASQKYAPPSGFTPWG